MCVGQTKSHSHPIVANKKWEGRSIAGRDGDYSNWPLTFELTTFCSRLNDEYLDKSCERVSVTRSVILLSSIS